MPESLSPVSAPVSLTTGTSLRPCTSKNSIDLSWSGLISRVSTRLCTSRYTCTIVLLVATTKSGPPLVCFGMVMVRSSRSVRTVERRLGRAPSCGGLTNVPRLEGHPHASVLGDAGQAEERGRGRGRHDHHHEGGLAPGQHRTDGHARRPGDAGEGAGVGQCRGAGQRG